MPYIRVQSQGLKQASRSIQQCEFRIGKIRAEFDRISRQLDWEVRSKSDIEWMLKKISGELDQEISDLRRMNFFLNSAVAQYDAVQKAAKKDFEVSALRLRPVNKRIKTIPGRPTPWYSIYVKNLEKSKNLLKVVSELGKNDEAGLTGNIFDYLSNLIKITTIDESNTPGFVKWCNLAKSSAAVEKGLYKVLKGWLDGDEKSLFEGRFKNIINYADIAGKSVAWLASIIVASGSDSYLDVAKAGKDGVDVGSAVFMTAVKETKAIKWPAHIYTAIIKSWMDFAGQAGDSIQKYSSDGKWTWGDTAAVGVEASVKGLDTLISSLTFGVVSLKTVDSDAAELAENLEQRACAWGEKAAEYIRSDSRLYEEYKNANQFNRTRILLWAIGKVGAGYL